MKHFQNRFRFFFAFVDSFCFLIQTYCGAVFFYIIAFVLLAGISYRFRCYIVDFLCKFVYYDTWNKMFKEAIFLVIENAFHIHDFFRSHFYMHANIKRFSIILLKIRHMMWNKVCLV